MGKKSHSLRVILIAALLLTGTASHAKNLQARIDSLLTVVSREKKDTSMVKLLNELSLAYRTIDADKALRYAQQELVLAEALRWKKGIAMANYTTGYIFVNPKRELDSAFIFLNESLNWAEQINDSFYLGMCYKQTAWIFHFQGNFRKGAGVHKALRKPERFCLLAGVE